MSQLETKAVEILDKLESLTESYAPQVTDAALSAVRISALGEFIQAFAAFFFLIGMFFGIKKLFALAKNNPSSGWDDACGISAIVGIAVGFGLIAEIMFTIFDVWLWMALINPELALAHKIIGL